MYAIQALSVADIDELAMRINDLTGRLSRILKSTVEEINSNGAAEVELGVFAEYSY
jgi:hypothetical protein